MNASDATAKQWAMILHLSQFATFVAPLIGLLVPIVIWQVKKNDIPSIDEHGKNIVNWMISAFIYTIGSGLLTIVLIGFAGLIAIAIMAVVFPIIGGIKANDGIAWKYPLSIAFLK